MLDPKRWLGEKGNPSKNNSPRTRAVARLCPPARPSPWPAARARCGGRRLQGRRTQRRGAGAAPCARGPRGHNGTSSREGAPLRKHGMHQDARPAAHACLSESTPRNGHAHPSVCCCDRGPVGVHCRRSNARALVEVNPQRAQMARQAPPVGGPDARATPVTITPPFRRACRPPPIRHLARHRVPQGLLGTRLAEGPTRTSGGTRGQAARWIGSAVARAPPCGRTFVHSCRFSNLAFGRDSFDPRSWVSECVVGAGANLLPRAYRGKEDGESDGSKVDFPDQRQPDPGWPQRGRSTLGRRALACAQWCKEAGGLHDPTCARLLSNDKVSAGRSNRTIQRRGAQW